MAIEDERRMTGEAHESVSIIERKRSLLETELKDIRAALDTVC